MENRGDKFTHNGLKENFYDILKEISEKKPRTTFTKEQEEDFLKDAIVIFEYLKSGIDINSSEIVINDGEIPFSCIEKTISNFSEKFCKNDRNFYTLFAYRNDDERPVKIYKNLGNENKIITREPEKLQDKIYISVTSKLFFLKSYSSLRIDAITKSELRRMVDYALKNDVILLYDATTNKDSEDPEHVKSIYEIENARKVAIEFRRCSADDNDKINCGYLVIPECLGFHDESHNENKNIRIYDILKEELKKENVSRKSLIKSFLNYANI